MTFERLTSTHKEEFTKAYKNLYHREPNFVSMNAIIAVEDGKMVGFMCYYIVPVIDSLWISEDKRGTKLWKQMVNATKDFLKTHVFFFAISRREKQLAKRYFKENRLPWEVYGKFHG